MFVIRNDRVVVADIATTIVWIEFLSASEFVDIEKKVDSWCGW